MKADWRQIEDIFQAALEHAPEKRAAFLEEACAEDASLAREVTSMLRAHTEAGEFLEQPALAWHAEAFAEATSAFPPGHSLGAYRIISLLGVGGMGEVYLAQDDELGRKVALKLVKGGFGTAEFVRHLRQEARILASLSDPHIARLYGAAVTPGGVPYLIMEYVEGERLDHFCTAGRLAMEEKLELFRKVCSAVAYAHQHLIIHRDLKPANIRVTAEGEPKLLDFGIAKLLDPDTTATGAGEQTITLASVMTPGYASPEQIKGEPMTTASDIYSLGVILYELLTGEKPYRLTSRRPDEISRVVTEKEPTRPSSFRRELTGDLDNILLMALRKEPARRYHSAGQFSEDLRRHLAGLPVLAHRDTAAYRASKFVRRHRGAVAAALLVLLALVGGLVTATWQARIAQRAQVRAETSRKQADRLNNFLENLLGSADPTRMGKDVEVSQVLDAAGQKLDRELAAEPEILAQAHATLSRAYHNLGLYDEAEQHSRAALALIRRLHGLDDPATARAESGLASILVDRYQPQQAVPLLRHALAVERREPVPDEGALANTLENLSFLYVGENQPGKAQPLAREALTRARAAWGEQDQRYIRVLTEMGNIQVGKRDYAAATAIFRRLVAFNDKLQPGGLGSVAPRINLCISLFNQEKLAEVEPVLSRLESDTRRLVGERGLPDAVAIAFRGCVDFAKGDYAPAIPLFRQSLKVLSGSYPPGQTTVVQCRALLGLCLTRTGRAAEGEPLLREALADGAQVDRADFAHTCGNLETVLGECLFTQKRYAEAEPLLLAGYTELKSRLGPQNKFTVQAAHRLHDLYTAWNKPSQATQFASVSATH